MSGQSAEKDAPPCDATTASGTPCQKRLYVSSDGEFWPHAGGHWFMSDAMYACLIDGHYDAASVLTHGPLVHLDVPCARVTSPDDWERPVEEPVTFRQATDGAHTRVLPPA